MSTLKDRLIDAALPHVVFDGWSETAFRKAVESADVTPAQARATFPRGAVDMALAFHRRGDMAMAAAVRASDPDEMRFRDRVAQAVRLRLEMAEDHREAVRRGMTLFALPMHAADGLRAVWGTADAIWTALGDTSADVNWYTKRATLSGVYSATVLYWLGDQSEGYRDTWAFLDRRIDDVMRIESAKARARKSPLIAKLMTGPNMILGRIKAPTRPPRDDFPGMWREPD